MTARKIGMSQGDWDEAKKRLLPTTPSVDISVTSSGSNSVAVNTVDTQINVRLDIHHVDVGQGEATLLTLMAEDICIASVLIDAGLETDGGGMLIRLLNTLKIDNLDAAIISHYDLDHCAGLPRLLNYLFEFPTDKDGNYQAIKIEKEKVSWDPIYVQNILLRCDPQHAKQTSATKAIGALIGESYYDKMEIVEKGDTIELDCDADVKDGLHLFKMTCLAVDNEGKGTGDFENAASIAWLVELGKYTYYTAGDLPSTHESAPLEDALGATISAKWGSLTAMKCGHHGAETCTSPAFLEAVKPKIAFISAGKQDGFGHPRTKTLLSLHGQSSVRVAFLTNCMYSRPWVDMIYTKNAYQSLKWHAENAATSAQNLREEFPENAGDIETTKQSMEGTVAAIQNFIGLLDDRVTALGDLRAELALYDETTITANILQKIGEAEQAFQRFVVNKNTLRARSVANQRDPSISVGSGRNAGRLHVAEATFNSFAKATSENLRDAAVLAEEFKDAREALGKKRDDFNVFVAGDSDAMGNIVLRLFASDASLDARVGFIGLHAGGGWRWLTLRFGDVDENNIKPPTDSYLSSVQVSSIAKLKIPGSPQKFTGYTDERSKKRTDRDKNVTTTKRSLRDWEDEDEQLRTKILAQTTTENGPPEPLPVGDPNKTT